MTEIAANKKDTNSPDSRQSAQSRCFFHITNSL